jgi:DNA-binding NarL/FixJ family response regulator
LLRGWRRSDICGEASNSSETLEKVDELKSDLILLDINMPGMNGSNTAQLLRQKHPALKILIISQHDANQLLPRSLEAGAHGCIDKARIATDLLPALRNLFKN